MASRVPQFSPWIKLEFPRVLPIEVTVHNHKRKTLSLHICPNVHEGELQDAPTAPGFTRQSIRDPHSNNTKISRRKMSQENWKNVQKYHSEGFWCEAKTMRTNAACILLHSSFQHLRAKKCSPWDLSWLCKTRVTSSTTDHHTATLDGPSTVHCFEPWSPKARTTMWPEELPREWSFPFSNFLEISSCLSPCNSENTIWLKNVWKFRGNQLIVSFVVCISFRSNISQLRKETKNSHTTWKLDPLVNAHWCLQPIIRSRGRGYSAQMYAMYHIQLTVTYPPHSSAIRFEAPK